jgi:hypothetical protein
MSSNKSTAEFLVFSVCESFRGLLGSGYRIVGESIYETPTQAVLEMVGSNVALRFSVDVRDGVVDFYITKAVNGRAAERGGGAYFNRLTGYLRERGLQWKTNGEQQPTPRTLEERIIEVRELE